MFKSCLFRAYPTKEQEEFFAKTFGSCRYVYNYYLTKCEETYKNEGHGLSYFQCSMDLTQLKHTKDHKWLNDADSYALHMTLRHLDHAYKMFRTKTNKNRLPKFKTKKNPRQTYQTRVSKGNKNSIQLLSDGKMVRLPKIGSIKVKGGYDKLPDGARITTATVRKSKSGKYFIGIEYEIDEKKLSPLPKTGQIVGIDIGINNLITISDGTKISNPRFLQKSLNKLQILRQAIQRKQSGSNNHEKARKRYAKLYEHVVNQRKDFLMKLANNLLHQYDIIYSEKIKIRNWYIDNFTKLNRSIDDCGLFSLFEIMRYKSIEYDKTFDDIKNAQFPSSKRCSNCGYISNLDLSTKEWICPKCNTHHDRDINAAINIRDEGIRLNMLK